MCECEGVCPPQESECEEYSQCLTQVLSSDFYTKLYDTQSHFQNADLISI